MTWKLNILPLSELEIWKSYYKRLLQTSVYHSADYIAFLAKYMGFCGAELAIYGDQESFVYYPYFLKSLDNVDQLRESSGGKTYHDIVSSWYYGGPLVCSRLEESQTRNLALSFLREFNGYCQERGFVSEFIRFDPNLKNHRLFEGLLEIVQNRETVYADLTKPPAQLDREMNSSVHRNVRNAVAAGLVLTEEQGEASYREFHQVYDLEMVRKKAPLHLYFPLEFFLEISHLPEMFRLLVVRQDGQYIGGFIICESELHAFHYLSASRYEFWHLRPNDMMFREAILSSQRYGRRIFDFQGGRAGVYRFKTKFTSTRGKFFTAQKIHQPENFQRFCAIMGVEPGESNFPPYRFAGVGTDKAIDKSA